MNNCLLSGQIISINQKQKNLLINITDPVTLKQRLVQLFWKDKKLLEHFQKLQTKNLLLQCQCIVESKPNKIHNFETKIWFEDFMISSFLKK